MDGLAARATRTASTASLRDAIHLSSSPDDPIELDEPAAEEDSPPPLPFFKSLCTGKVHLVALPPFTDANAATTTLCAWDISTDTGVQLAAVPAGAHKCLRCGPLSVWVMACDVASHLATPYDAE